MEILRAESVRRRSLVWIYSLGLSMVLGIAGQLLMKHGLQAGASPALASYAPAHILKWTAAHPLVLAGLTIYCTGTLFWLLTVSRVNLSFVYPLTSLNFVLILLTARWFFGESLSWGRIVGVLVICIGVALVTYKESSSYDPSSLDTQ